MSVGMQPIYTQTLTSTTAAVTFNNIPQTYTDLLIVGTSLRDISSGTGSAILRFNGNSESVYSTTRYYGIGSSGNGTQRQTNTTYGWYGEAGEGAIGEYPVSNSILIPNYTSGIPKTWTSESARERDNTATYMVHVAGLWRKNDPITSITLYPEQSGTSWSAGTKFSLYGLLKTGRQPKASGGQITFDGTYFYHAFKTVGSSSFIPNQNLTADILIIGGGGSGCTSTFYQGGGGGGAGGVLYSTGQSLTSGTSYAVTVGAGGVAPVADNSDLSGRPGNNSSFASLIAIGGGAGGGGDGGSGGSGGGGGSQPQATSGGLAGSGTVGQGNAGGKGFWSGSYGAGGGGAGASAANASSGLPTAGGAGTSSYSLWGLMTGTGQNVSGTWWYAGGGGGGYQGTIAGYAGGNGGGGTGGAGGSSTAPTDGLVNTGGGGGGAGANGATANYRGGTGGSGVVIVRYTA